MSIHKCRFNEQEFPNLTYQVEDNVFSFLDKDYKDSWDEADAYTNRVIDNLKKYDVGLNEMTPENVKNVVSV